jgi:hypothetical protein
MTVLVVSPIVVVVCVRVTFLVVVVDVVSEVTEVIVVVVDVEDVVVVVVVDDVGVVDGVVVGVEVSVGVNVGVVGALVDGEVGVVVGVVVGLVGGGFGSTHFELPPFHFHLHGGPRLAHLVYHVALSQSTRTAHGASMVVVVGAWVAVIGGRVTPATHRSRSILDVL